MSDRVRPGGFPTDEGVPAAGDGRRGPRPGVATVLAVAGVAALSVVVFVVSLVVMNSPVLDAVGETFGTVALVLLLISILGAVTRRAPPR